MFLLKKFLGNTESIILIVMFLLYKRNLYCSSSSEILWEKYILYIFELSIAFVHNTENQQIG